MNNKKMKTKGTPDLVDKHVGHRLRVRRSLMGMSQEKLAEAIDLTFQQIQKYERGVNRISAGRLFQFSKILNVPVAYFYEQYKDSSLKPTASLSGMADNNQEAFEGANGNEKDIFQRKETLDLLRTYYSIEDEALRKDLYKFVKSMAEKMHSS